MAAVSQIVFFLLLTSLAQSSLGKVNAKSAVYTDIVEAKDFKKLLRTKNNVLVLFVSHLKDAPLEWKVFREAANTVRGTGTMVLVDCSSADKKKLCKKLKVAPEPYVLKHYKDGDFHKNYERQMAVSSIVNFMRDPSGDLPWEEDAAGADVLHFSDFQSFLQHLKKDPRPLLIMFYVPWCGYCKRLKPDYSKAAAELKSKGYLLGAMDLERQENAPARKAYNVTGFPTILYFENGRVVKAYEGSNTKDDIISFMQDPSMPSMKKSKDPDWSMDTESEVVHLTTQGFFPAIKDEKSALVMFYAPWCGHCKRMKPEYEKAALTMREQRIPGVLAAVDATKEPSIAEKYNVRGYPTIKYFVKGEFKFDANVREAAKIIDFMLDPKEPPPPEKPWEEEEDIEVVFLTDENFSTLLKRKKHALVMFYAPWCGHCKNSKPEFNAAAESFKDDPRIMFAAVDCTRYATVCATYDVRGYPTLKYFSYLKIKTDYSGRRNRKDFINFMTNASSDSRSLKDDHDEL